MKDEQQESGINNITNLEASSWEAAVNLRANSKLTSSESCLPVPGIILFTTRDQSLQRSTTKT
jgi:hypothetical protein